MWGDLRNQGAQKHVVIMLHPRTAHQQRRRVIENTHSRSILASLPLLRPFAVQALDFRCLFSNFPFQHTDLLGQNNVVVF